MTKWEFVNELNVRLKEFPKSEIDRYADYYLGIIKEKMKKGMSEEEAVASVGSLDDIETRIRFEKTANISWEERTGKHAKEKQGRLKTWHIVLIAAAIIFFFPVSVPILIGIAALIFGLLLAAAVILLSLYVVAAASALGGMGFILSGIISFGAKGLAYGLLSIGLGLVIIAVQILFFVALNRLFQLFRTGVRSFFGKITEKFPKRRQAV